MLYYVSQAETLSGILLGKIPWFRCRVNALANFRDQSRRKMAETDDS